MKILHRLAVLGLTGAIVAACSSIDLDKTKMATLKGDAFQKALFTEYVDLARLEDQEADTEDAVYFNNRALMAADGKDSGPQPISERKIPNSAMGDITAARKALTDALAGGAAKASPAKAARAQAMFDCWLQEQEENDQPEDIARCRSAFEEAMKGLGGKPATKKKGKADAEFVIYFGFDSANMDEAAMGVAYDVMAATVSGVKAILLTGHADTSGDKGYNRKLSEMRVENVKATFSEIGIDPTKVVTQFYGEDQPAQSTGDGVKNAKNRRVTVVVKY